MTQILKTRVAVGPSIIDCDTIEHEGGLWLVPRWLTNLATGMQSPLRIIRMDLLRHQKLNPPMGGANFLLNRPMPMSVLENGETLAEGEQYEVIESPPIQMPVPTRLH